MQHRAHSQDCLEVEVQNQTGMLSIVRELFFQAELTFTALLRETAGYINLCQGD